MGYPTADALSAPLITLRTKDPQAYVLIRADQDVQYSNVADLMNACATAGIGTVTFSVIAKVGKTTPAPDAGASASN